MSEPETKEQPPLESWAIVSKLGHRVMAGRITEESRFGAVMGRCDVPQPDGTFVTEYFSAASLYGVQLCTEEVARSHHTNRQPPKPVGQLESPLRRHQWDEDDDNYYTDDEIDEDDDLEALDSDLAETAKEVGTPVQHRAEGVWDDEPPYGPGDDPSNPDDTGVSVYDAAKPEMDWDNTYLRFVSEMSRHDRETITVIFTPLLERYANGERTLGLYNAMRQTS